MNDPFDDRIADTLHAEATIAPHDADAAHALFLRRRRRHQQRLVTAGAVAAAAVVIVAGVLALATHHTGKSVPVAATGRTTEPQPLEGTPGGGTADASETTTTAAHTTTTGAARATSGGTVSGSAATVRPVPPPATTTPTPTTSVSTPPGGHQTVNVSEADNGKSYTLHAGDTLHVGLAGGTGYYWSKPQSSDDNVLRPTGPAYMPTADGGNAANFAAASGGHADVTSTGDLPCRQSTPPCMAPSKSFVVHVTVVP